MLHNLGLDFAGNNEVSRILSDHSGAVAVSIFFFLSGYGILKSYQKNGNKFLVKLIFQNALKLYIVSVCINILEWLVFFRNSFETPDLLMRIFNLDIFNNFNRMNRHGWFISTIIIMYVIFALTIFIFSKMNFKNNIMVGALVVVLITVIIKVISIASHKGGMYTNGLPCFALGILYALFYEFSNKICTKYRIPIEICCLVISAISFVFLWATAAGYLMCIFIVCISTKYRYDNKITLFLGRISLGIYLMLHFSTLTLSSIINNVYFWVLCNVGFILLLALILHGIILLIEMIVKKVKESSIKKEYL